MPDHAIWKTLTILFVKLSMDRSLQYTGNKFYMIT